jgi:flagellar hook protein FlgE
MNSSFYNGVSGVATHQYGIDVWSNNIANINNYGFKANTPEFKNFFDSTISQNNYGDIYNTNDGNGATMQSTATDMKQGALVVTENIFDLAISGQGWFGIQNQDGNRYFTRSGEFTKDANGSLVDKAGNYLLGTSANNINENDEVAIVDEITLNTVDAQTPITLPSYLKMLGQPTTNLFFGTNLNPEVVVDVTNIPIDATDYTTTVTNNSLDISGNVSNTQEILNPQFEDTVLITVYDQYGLEVRKFTHLDESLQWSYNNIDLSTLTFDDPAELSYDIQLTTTQEIVNTEEYGIEVFSPTGEKQTLSFEFKKEVPQDPNAIVWNGTATLYKFYEKIDTSKSYDPTQYFVDQNLNKVYEIIDNQTGTLNFNQEGALIGNTFTNISNNGVPLNLDFGTLYDPNIANSGFDGFTSFAGVDMDRQNVVERDGYFYGELNGYKIDGNGQVIAEFTNGKTSAMAKVALHHFQNDQGLEKMGDNTFASTSNSGEAKFFNDVIDTHSSKILSGWLESSNVYMGEALTELMVYQKALQANAKSITTSDEMIQRAINMKT